jgi:hypothetical protein
MFWGFGPLRKPRLVITVSAIAIAGLMIASCRRSVREELTAESIEDIAALSAMERREVKTYVANMEPMDIAPPEVNVLLATDEDIWLGMRYEGLHRYDRKTSTWCSYQQRIGDRIQQIWQERSRVWVDHETWGNHTFFYVSYTDDRGKTWKKFLIGDASRDYVHAPEFTNRGLRSERLERITKALKRGEYPDELVVHKEIGGEVYFTIYVNSAEGWNVLYRYDLATDRLRDLAIAELDPGAVGVRQFYLDPHEIHLVWILSGGYGGAIQSPQRWFLYDRKTEKTRDIGVGYSGGEGYLHLVDGEWEYMDIISFEPDRVLLLGGDEEKIHPVAEYDRATKQVKRL